MLRDVRSTLTVRPSPGTRMVFAIAVAEAEGVTCGQESLRVISPHGEISAVEVQDHHGGRLHVIDIPEDFEAAPRPPRGSEPERDTDADGFPRGSVAPGTVRVDYRSLVRGAESAPVGDEADLIRYVRPSRYAESDKLFPTSGKLFGSLTGQELVDAVSSWVQSHISYVPGFSRGTDGAVDTFLARQGICRDFAHLVVALLRPRNTPARVVAGYAPGLRPMDFHAVAEAWVDGAWQLIDATGLAEMSSLARISTGADASDTAFLSTVQGGITLEHIKVDAHLLEDQQG